MILTTKYLQSDNYFADAISENATYIAINF